MIYSFQNPSILAQALAIIVVGFLWLLANIKVKVLKYLSIFILVFLLGVIVYLNSRISILSILAAAIYIAYPYIPHVKKKIFLATSFFTFVACIILFTLFFKQDSSSSRLFIWQRCLELWKQNWFTGTGAGKFNPAYNHIQTEYFSSHSLVSKEAMLANDGYFAFNEWLHISIEFGVIGLILSLVLTSFILKACYKNIGTKKSWAGAMLIPVFIGSLFSYPLHNIYILATTIFLSIYITLVSYRFSIFYDKWIRGFTVASLISVTAFLGIRNFKAQQLFENIKQTAREGFRNDAVILCHNAPQALQNDYSFQIFYLNLLYQTNRLKEGVNYFNQFHFNHCNQKAHTLVAKSYEELNELKKAEEHYLKSLYIVPQLLQSRIDLMGFYDRSKNIFKAKYWAQQTLDCPIKIANPLALQLKEQAKVYLTLHQ